MGNKKIITTKRGQKIEVNTAKEICQKYGRKSGSWIEIKIKSNVFKIGIVQGVAPCGTGSPFMVLWVLFEGDKECVYIPRR